MRARASMAVEASLVVPLLVLVIGPPARDTPAPPPATLSDGWTGDAASPTVVTTTMVCGRSGNPVPSASKSEAMCL